MPLRYVRVVLNYQKSLLLFLIGNRVVIPQGWTVA